MKNKIFFVLIILSLFLSRIILAQESPTQSPLDEGADTIKSVEQNKISLDTKRMDVVDVLKMLAGRSGMNIVVGKNVTGKVTLFLKDVNLWDAFEIILLANDLAYEKKGDIINVMTQRDYELLYGAPYRDKTQIKIIQLKYAKATYLSQALTQIKSNVGRIVPDEGSNTLVLLDTPEKLQRMVNFIRNADLPLATQVFNLNYASAEKINPKLQEALTKNVGSIKIDERTNKIAISDYPEKLDYIAKLISAFDEKPQQVLIDAQVIEIKPSDKFEMGVDWEYWIKNHFKVTESLPVGTSGRLFLGTPSTTPSKPRDYKAIVDLLRTIGDAKILSSPRIMVINNQEAKILVGTKDAYITSTTSLSGTGTTVISQSINFVDVGIKLHVTPTINRNGFVIMKIKPEVSSAERTSITSEGKITQIPIVTTSETETAVVVKDGITILIGGLKKDERQKTVKKIPLIGDIPLLGMFFRSTSDEIKKTDLVILLTPHIMSGETPLTDFADITPEEGAIAKMVKGDIVTQKVSSSKKQEGASGSLNLTTPEYNRLVSNKINQSAHLNSPRGKKGSVTLSFSLYREGYLTEDPHVTKASDHSLIPFAIKAIKDALPFPSFPKDIEKKEERFSITINYQ